MDTLTQPQINLLVRAATDGGITDRRYGKTATVLVQGGLLCAEPDSDSGECWRITEAGRTAVGIASAADDAPPEAPEEVAQDEVDNQAAPPQPKGKIATLVDLLKRPEGAAVAVLMDATGWQAHSVRGAIAGAIKTKLGLTVISEKVDGVRLYRIPAVAKPEGEV